MSNEVVFFSRCRPQDADPIDLVVRERRIFIGYPAWREGVKPSRGHFRESVIDFLSPDEEWYSCLKEMGKQANRKQYQQNRNFIQEIKVGAIGLVPRPNRGVVYAGRVQRPFELLDDPPWGEEYLNLRRDQGLDIDEWESHLGDVIQCCTVDQFREIPFPLIPAWIRKSFFGRSTYGRIWPMEELGLDPHLELDRLIDNPDRAIPPWTSDVAEVEHRLLDSVGPTPFEHLCVALLQLEHPEHVWSHVGGSGDGGVDGIGASADGNVIGLLQCKWRYWGDEVVLANPAAKGEVRQVLAALLHPTDVQPSTNVEFWSRRHVAGLVIKHADRLPLALSLRVRASGC